MKFLRILLFPISILYGLLQFFRNLFFDSGVLKSHKYKIPIISVGNILVGGTGKSPMVEYLVRLLISDYKIATLSRGYKRKTSGFVEASSLSTVDEIGDESVQIKQKFNELTVAVCENRRVGIEHLSAQNEVILLDDAFQHRSVKPGLSILLYDYPRVFNTEFLLPMGNLREPKSEMERADIIVITKTPKIFSPMERRRVEAGIKPKPHQKIFYSYIEYSELVAINSPHNVINLEELNKKAKVLLITGIAHPQTLLNYVEMYSKNITHLEYPDHYKFSIRDVRMFKHKFENFEQKEKIIITTEKDAARLLSTKIIHELQDLPIYYLPIKSEIHKEDKEEFDTIIKEYVRSNK